ncbi:MAG: hypothetical protein KKE20_06435 [Nanoarchaeota archaeon]|nr:hypothetical protein [Nanoarchaeota archaeon]
MAIKNGNGIRVEKLEKQLRIGPAKCPEQAVSSLAVWPGKTNFLAYPSFYDVVTHGKQFFDLIEIQAQCPGDFYNNQEVVRNAIELCHKEGIEPTLHFPFMDIEKTGLGFKVFQMPLVIPTARHTVPPGYNAGNYNVEFAIKEMDPQLVKDFIDFGSSVGVNYATLHISVPGSRFTPAELERYISILGPLADYAHKKDFSISVETGGATLEQIMKIAELPVSFTNDIVHTTIDGLDAVEVCRQLGERVTKLHLSESPYGKDGHQQLSPDGNYTGITRQVLGEVINLQTQARMQGRVYSPLVVFESAVSEGIITGESTEDQNASVFSYITDSLVNKQKVLIFTHGLTRSGKSNIIGKISDSLSDSNLDVRKISTDLERPVEQHESTLNSEFVPTTDRAKVYGKILEKVDSCYQDGADVVAVDGTFGLREWREKFIQYAKDNGYTLYIIRTECPDWDSTKTRLEERVVEGVKIPISQDIYRKQAEEFQPLNPVEVEGTGATIIRYDSYNSTLSVEAGKRQTSPIADKITDTLMKYAEVRDSGRR